MVLLIPLGFTLLYAFLGYKLGKNFILWGLMGLGIFMALPLLALFFLWAFDNPVIGIVIWQLGLTLSFLLSLAIAIIIALKHNSVFKKRS